MPEFLERLLFVKFLAVQGDRSFPESLSQQSKIHLEEFVTASKENELTLLSDEEFTTKIYGYINFRKAVRQGNYGKHRCCGWHTWIMFGSC